MTNNIRSTRKKKGATYSTTLPATVPYNPHHEIERIATKLMTNEIINLGTGTGAILQYT